MECDVCVLYVHNLFFSLESPSEKLNIKKKAIEFIHQETTPSAFRTYFKIPSKLYYTYMFL